jgi:LPS export ABC transporter protein LptC
MKQYLYIFILVFLLSCSNDIGEVNAITSGVNTSIDIGKNVVMTYSDSAETKVIIEGATLEKYNSINNPKEIFPDGVKVTFLNSNRKPGSWLTAETAIRDPKAKKVYVRGNVNFYNSDKDKLQSHELIWDEKEGRIYTEKFVKITRPIQGDTLYGLGFETDEEFKKITIKRRNQGKMSISGLE